MPLQFLFRSAAEEEAVALFRQQLVAAVWRPSSDEMHTALAAWEAKLVDTQNSWATRRWIEMRGGKRSPPPCCRSPRQDADRCFAQFL